MSELPPLRGGPPDRAYLRLLEDHGPALVAMLRRLCGHPGDADDVFQETAVRVWRAFPGRPRLRNPRGWVLTIGYRAYADWRAGQPRRCGEADVGLVPDARAVSAEDRAERREDEDRLRAALRALPVGLRDVVTLHYAGGMSLGRIAAATGLPVGTVKSRLNAALVRLRSLLA